MLSRAGSRVVSRTSTPTQASSPLSASPLDAAVDIVRPSTADKVLAVCQDRLDLALTPADSPKGEGHEKRATTGAANLLSPSISPGSKTKGGAVIVKDIAGSAPFRSRRRLTVDCSQRHIDDVVADGSQRQHPAQAIQTPGAVLSVWGSETKDKDRFAAKFAHKALNFDGELSGMKHRVGMLSQRGHKPQSPNQDDLFILARDESLLLGVLDGHGPNGHEVAHFAQEHLPTYIVEDLRKNGKSWDQSVRNSVERVMKELTQDDPKKVDHSGTTVSITMLDRPDGAVSGPMRVRCAYLGDSITVVAKRKSKGDAWEVQQLTDIHRPDREDEMKRIRKAGGEVAESQVPGMPSRLLTRDWNLAMSRSLGDVHAVAYGLSHEPEFSSSTLEEGYEHLILAASDGVWDVIPPAQAVALVGKFAPDEAQVAVEKLVSKAQLRWRQMEDVVDDITALLVWPEPGLARAGPDDT